MPVVSLYPNTTSGATISGWDQSGATFLDNISDGDAGSYVTQNQVGASVLIHVADSEAAAEGTINGASIFVTHKAGGKGAAEGQIRIYDFNNSQTIALENFSISSTDFTTYEVCATTDVTPDMIKDLGVYFTNTSGQSVLADIRIDIDYTAAVTTPVHFKLTDGLVELTDGKISL